MSDYEHWGTAERAVIVVMLAILTIGAALMSLHLLAEYDYGYYQKIAIFSAASWLMYFCLYLAVVNAVDGLVYTLEGAEMEYGSRTQKIVAALYMFFAGFVLLTALRAMNGAPLLVHLCGAGIPALLFVLKAVDPFVDDLFIDWLENRGESA